MAADDLEEPLSPSQDEKCMGSLGASCMLCEWGRRESLGLHEGTDVTRTLVPDPTTSPSTKRQLTSQPADDWMKSLEERIKLLHRGLDLGHLSPRRPCGANMAPLKPTPRSTPLIATSLVPRPRFPTAAGGLHHRYVSRLTASTSSAISAIAKRVKYRVKNNGTCLLLIAMMTLMFWVASNPSSWFSSSSIVRWTCGGAVVCVPKGTGQENNGEYVTQCFDTGVLRHDVIALQVCYSNFSNAECAC